MELIVHLNRGNCVWSRFVELFFDVCDDVTDDVNFVWQCGLSWRWFQACLVNTWLHVETGYTFDKPPSPNSDLFCHVISVPMISDTSGRHGTTKVSNARGMLA